MRRRRRSGAPTSSLIARRPPSELPTRSRLRWRHALAGFDATGANGPAGMTWDCQPGPGTAPAHAVAANDPACLLNSTGVPQTGPGQITTTCTMTDDGGLVAGLPNYVSAASCAAAIVAAPLSTITCTAVPLTNVPADPATCVVGTTSASYPFDLITWCSGPIPAAGPARAVHVSNDGDRAQLRDHDLRAHRAGDDGGADLHADVLVTRRPRAGPRHGRLDDVHPERDRGPVRGQDHDHGDDHRHRQRRRGRSGRRSEFGDHCRRWRLLCQRGELPSARSAFLPAVGSLQGRHDGARRQLELPGRRGAVLLPRPTSGRLATLGKPGQHRL